VRKWGQTPFGGFPPGRTPRQKNGGGTHRAPQAALANSSANWGMTVLQTDDGSAESTTPPGIGETAPEPSAAYSAISELPPDLRTLVAFWSQLPYELRRGILAIVAAFHR
jgi:hypothetical protein